MTKSYKLKDICIEITDGSHFSPMASETGFPMFSVKDMREFGFSYDSCKYISKNDFDKMKKSGCVPQKDDILVAKDGSYLKEIFRCKETKDEAVLSSIAIFRPNKEIVDSSFLCYLLKTPNIYTFIKENCVSGSALPRIILKAFKEVKVEIPSLDTQCKIAAILSAIDDKIELNNRMNENLEEQLMTNYYQVIESGNDATLDSLICSIEAGSRPKGGALEFGVPSIGAEKIERIGIYDYTKEKYISEEFFCKLKKGIIKSGDVLIYKDGAYTGKSSMFKNDFPYQRCAVNEHVFIVRTKNMKYQTYLYCTLQSKENRTYIENLAAGKAAQPGLNQPELLSTPIKLNSFEEIENFELFAEPIVDKIFNNSKENKRLAELRDTLLPKLMSGEIDVSKVEVN